MLLFKLLNYAKDVRERSSPFVVIEPLFIMVLESLILFYLMERKLNMNKLFINKEIYMTKTQYTVYVVWPNGTEGTTSFSQRGEAVAYQIACIKQGATATINRL